MGLPKLGGDWQDDVIAIHEALFQKAVISIFDPTRKVDGKPVAVIDHRRARVQHQRSPQIATDAGQQLAKRAFIFEFTPKPTDPLIGKDMLVRVHSAERDTHLEVYGFTVTNSVNSSEMALRYVETLTELVPLPRIP